VAATHLDGQLGYRPVALLADERRNLRVFGRTQHRWRSTAVRLGLNASFATKPIHQSIDGGLSDGKTLRHLAERRRGLLVRFQDSPSKIDRKWLRHIHVRSDHRSRRNFSINRDDQRFKQPEDARNIKGKVLVCIGAEDPLIPPEQRLDFEREMRAGKVDWRLYLFGNAVHGFANPDAGRFGHPALAYHRPTDERSFRAMRDLFDETFGPI
jgi:hypothetical protein